MSVRVISAIRTSISTDGTGLSSLATTSQDVRPLLAGAPEQDHVAILVDHDPADRDDGGRRLLPGRRAAGLARRCPQLQAEHVVQRLGQFLGLGVPHLVAEERFLHRVAVLRVEDPGPLLDMVQLRRVVDEDDQLVRGLERQQRHVARAAHADIVAFVDHHRGQFVREGVHVQEARMQDDAVLALEHGLVQDFHHVDGAGDDIGAALQEQRGAPGFHSRSRCPVP